MSRPPRTRQSLFYDRVIPALFVVLAVIMLALVIFALGVATGGVAWL